MSKRHRREAAMSAFATLACATEPVLMLDTAANANMPKEPMDAACSNTPQLLADRVSPRWERLVELEAGRALFNAAGPLHATVTGRGRAEASNSSKKEGPQDICYIRDAISANS
eukprot:2731858-Pleurochrysis_carterae.AAC.2